MTSIVFLINWLKRIGLMVFGFTFTYEIPV
jgi:hypothetical protein